MMKKKVMAGLLTGALALGMLAGCSGGSAASSAAADEVQLTLIMAVRDEWLSELETAALNAAKEIGGINLTTQDANQDVSKQLQYIETACNAGADAVIINMVDPATAAQCVEAAGDVPVVFVNRCPTDTSVLGEKVVYVGSNEITSGQFQGEWLAAWAKEQGKDEVRYVMMMGTPGLPSTTARTEGFVQGMEAAGVKATLVSEALNGEFDRAKAMDKFTPLIGTEEFDAVVSNNDSMALGVVEALESKNVDPSTVQILGIDASGDGRAAIKEGRLAMSVFQDPKGQGRGCLHAAVNLMQGNDLAQDTGYEKDETSFILWVPFEPVDAKNIAEYDAR